MSGKIIGANLKYNRPLRQGGVHQYLATLVNALAQMKDRKTVVRVFPHELALISERKDRGLWQFSEGAGAVEIGNQDIHHTEDGSFTGAPLSPSDILALGIKHTLGGHSETVVYGGVKDTDVAKKLDAARRAGIHMTVCIGLMPDVEKSPNAAGALVDQVNTRIISVLSDRDKEGGPDFDVAWETVGAIKGFAELWGLPPNPPSDARIVESHALIRTAFNDSGFISIADGLKISYGGSASPENAKHLLGLPGVDGLLVGTASWDVNKMIAMCQIAERIG